MKNPKNMMRLIAVLVMVCLLAVVGPMALAEEDTPQEVELTVNGIDAGVTPSGEGWSFDAETNTLTLSGYNGGSIVYEGAEDLTVVLAEGSENVIVADFEHIDPTGSDSLGWCGIYCRRATLYLVGQEGNSLHITSKCHALQSFNMQIDGCNITAVGTVKNATAKKQGLICSRGSLIINDSIIHANSKDVAISGFNTMEITGCTVTAVAAYPYTGIHSQFTGKITDSHLDISGSPNTAVQSVDGVMIMKNCTGTLQAAQASVYSGHAGNSLIVDHVTELDGCNLTLNAAYGVYAASPTVIDNSTLACNSANYAVYTYSKNLDADLTVSGTSDLSNSGTAAIPYRVMGTLDWEDTAEITGLLLEQTSSGNRDVLCGDITLTAVPSNRRVVIHENSTVTVPENTTVDFSSVPSLTVNGTLINNGTVKTKDATTTVAGTLTNNATLDLTDGVGVDVTGGSVQGVPARKMEAEKTSLSLGSGVSLNQYFTISGLGDTDVVANGGLLYWEGEEQNATVNTAGVHKVEGLVETDAQEHIYGQQIKNLPAKNLSNGYSMRAYVVTENGDYVYSPAVTHSVKEYCMDRINNSTDDDLKSVCAAVLHYGAEAQKYFGYKQNDLMDADVPEGTLQSTWSPEMMVSLKAVPSSSITGEKLLKAHSLSLFSEVYINYYYDKTYGDKSATLLVWKEGTEELTEENAIKIPMMEHGTTNASYWTAQGPLIVAKELSDTQYSCVKIVRSDDSVEYSSITAYSVFEYARKKMDSASLENVLKAMVVYGTEAKAYFTTK